MSLPDAMRQAHRLVNPDGAVVFSEPYGNNPILELARRHVTYPGQEGHAVDRPLLRREIEEAAAPYFSHVELEPHRLLEVFPWFLETALEGAAPRLHRLLRHVCGAVRRVFRAVDAALLLVVPRLGDYCQIVNLRLSGPRALGS